MPRSSLLLGCLLLFASPAAGRDIFVDNDIGNDLFDGLRAEPGGDRGGPVRSFKKALRLTRSGDRVVVANTGRPYRECLTLAGGNHSGDSLGPFTILGNGATLDGTAPIRPRDWEHYRADVFRYRPRRMAFQILYLAGKPAVRAPAVAEDDPLVALRPLEWCLHQGAIYFRVEPKKSVYSYDLACCGETVGITLHQVRDVVIADLVVQGYQLDGVAAHDLVEDCTLVGLTCRGNGRSGVAVSGASEVAIESCLLGDNGHCQLFTEGFSTTVLRDVELLANTAPAVISEGGEVIEAEPLQAAE